MERKDLRAYLRPVLKRWWLILAVVPVVTIGTYLYYDHKPKVYSASTELFVQQSTLNQLLVGSTSSTSTSSVENLALLIRTKAVAELATKELAKEHAPTTGGGISAQPIEKSNFIVISATAATPRGAAQLANAYAHAFANIQTRQLRGEASQTLETAQKQLDHLGTGPTASVQREGLEAKIQTLQLLAAQPGSAGIRQVEPATPSSVPVNHDPKSNAIFAFVISLMLAVGAAFGLEYLTRKIISVEDVEEIFERPVLTEIPNVDTPAPTGADGVSMGKELHEPFHRLQMNLDMLSHDRPLRTILVASAAPGEGKSIVTRNLALAFREAGRNVAVLDADFRKATLGGMLDAQEGPGLTDILAGRASFGQTVQEVVVLRSENGNGATGTYVAVPGGTPVGKASHGNLAMVPAGAHHGNLAAALASGGMRQTLKTATDVYDRVLIDSSPILAAADVLPLLSEVDGVLLVTRLGVSTQDSAKRLLSELKRLSDVQVLGVVVNGIPPRIYRTRSYGYYYG